MSVWSPDVQGIIEMSDPPRKTVYRSKTLQPIRNKTPVHPTMSLPASHIKILSSEPTANMENVVRFDLQNKRAGYNEV